MNPIVVQRWSDISDQPLTEAAIRARHPRPRYRVSARRYPPGARFAGSSRAGTSYVVSGAVRFDVGAEVTLRAGELAELPEGRFELEVLGEQPLVLVQCWELPGDLDGGP